MTINGLILLDLFFLMRNPLFPKERRAKFYWGILITFNSIMMFLTFKYWTSNVNAEKDYFDHIIYTTSYAICALTIIPSILVMFQICKLNTSRSYKCELLSRHVSYVTLFIAQTLLVIVRRSMDAPSDS